jgi:hypothetical protein
MSDYDDRYNEDDEYFGNKVAELQDTADKEDAWLEKAGLLEADNQTQQEYLDSRYEEEQRLAHEAIGNQLMADEGVDDIPSDD